MDIESSWGNVLHYLLDSKNNEIVASDSKEGVELIKYCAHLHKENAFPILNEWLVDELNRNLVIELKSLFWNIFKTDISDNNVMEVVHNAFGNLHNILSSQITPFYKLKSLECKLKNKFFIKEKVKKIFSILCFPILNNIILFSSKNNYDQYIKLYLKQNFEIWDKIVDNKNVTLEEPTDDLDFRLQNNLKPFIEFVHNLLEWKILYLVITEPLMDLLYEKIELYIKSICEAPFEKSYIDLIFEWIYKNIINSPQNIFNKLNSDVSVIKFELCHIEKFKLHAVEVYGWARIDQLFNIIIEYPESHPVLNDLVICLSMNSSLKEILVTSLKNALKTRLLHQGVTTTDILSAYISTMRALRILDLSGVMLEMVGEPVKKYLKQRDDTVRSIVTSLTEDCNDDLANELNRKMLLAEDDDSGEESIDPNNWNKWQPDPVEAEPLKTSQASRAFDIVSMLVNIYGSKEVFIDEYRTLLADRILTQLNYDMDREIRNLELLKLRFGESQLHQCEVMLKDVSDSRRINSQILENDLAQENSTVVPIQSIILSGQFWPARLRDDNVELPQCLLHSMQHYKKRFEILKGNRTLIWKPHLGLVDMEIELNGKSMSIVVSPVHATIVWHFQKKAEYSLEELSGLMQMPTQALHRKIVFWQRKGVLKENGTDCYSLVDELRVMPSEELNPNDEFSESALISSKDQKEEEFQVVWSYVVGMLTNLESLTLERIHSMLKMFAIQGPGSQCSMDELKSILDCKLKDSKLTYFNSTYRLTHSVA